MIYNTAQEVVSYNQCVGKRSHAAIRAFHKILPKVNFQLHSVTVTLNVLLWSDRIVQRQEACIKELSILQSSLGLYLPIKGII